MNLWDWLLGFVFGRRRARPAPPSEEPRAPQGNPPAAPPPSRPPPRPSPPTSTTPDPGPAPPASPAPPAAPQLDFIDSLTMQSRTLVGPADYEAAAAELGCERAAIQAVAQVESGRLGPFDTATGRMIILFEPHHFSSRSNRVFDQTHPHISYRRWGQRPYPNSQADRYAQLREAHALDPAAALKSASWGRFQIMGFNHRMCGHATVEAFVTDLAQSDARHLAAFVRFIQADRVLLNAIRSKNWALFAEKYNGPRYAEHDYHGKMARAYASLGAGQA